MEGINEHYCTKKIRVKAGVIDEEQSGVGEVRALYNCKLLEQPRQLLQSN